RCERRTTGVVAGGNAENPSVVSSRVRRRSCLLSLVALGCETARPTTRASPTTSDSPASESYAERKAHVASIRSALASELATITNEASRRVTLRRARQALRSAIVDTLLPAWIGTDWAFDGTTEEPGGAGGIACGYFVATILQHAGLRLESRRRFGQATAL